MVSGFPCRDPGCHQVFASAQARSVHNRKHKTTFTMMHPDGTQEVLHKQGDAFPCPADDCVQTFTLGHTARRHYFKVHLHPDSDRQPDVDPDDLLVNQDLFITPDPSRTPQILKDTHLCIVLHRDLLLLICTLCHCTVSLYDDTASVVNHVRGHRSRLSRRRTTCDGDAELNEALEREIFTSPCDASIQPYTRDPPSALLPPVPGLVIVNGFSCKICTYYCGARTTMRNHRCKKHNDLPYQDVAAPCQVQIMYRDRTLLEVKYFGVRHHDLPVADDHAGMAELIMNQFVTHFRSLRTNLNPPVVELAPWLAESGWNEIALKFMPKGVPFLDLKSQMSPPPKGDRSPLSRVAPLVFAYMEAVQYLIAKAPVDYRLRRLVEQRSTHEEVTRGFNPLYVASSRERYSDLMTSFVLCLLRSFMVGPASVLHLFRTNRDDMQAALDQLLHQLADLDAESAQPPDLRVLHQVMLGIWTPLIPEIFEPTTSADCLFTRFLVLGSLVKVRDDANSDEYAFRHVRYLTQPMAMLKYWAKAVLLMHMGQKFWCRSPQTLLTGEVDRLLCYVKDVALPTPFNTVCEWLRLAHHITAGEPTHPRLVPLDDSFSNCLLDGEHITLAAFRDMLQAIIREAHAIMDRDVLIGLRTDWIGGVLKGKATITDKLYNVDPTYTFVTDPANDHTLGAHRADLLKHLFSGPPRGRFVLACSDLNEVVWNTDSLRDWMVSCADLQERLTLLIHFVAALPSRGDEYKSFNMRNTATGIRTFFWDMLGEQGPTLSILQTYHKGANSGTPMKPTLKYVPPLLTRLFLTYFALVRPLQSYVAGLLWGPDVALLYEDSWFVEMDTRLSGDDLSDSIRNAFTKHCGVPFGISEYRHLAAFFSSRIRQQHHRILDDPVDLNGGHSSLTAGLHYARSNNDFRYLASNVKRQHQLVVQKWHATLGVGPPPSSTQLPDEPDLVPSTPPISVTPRPRHPHLDDGHPTKTRVVCCHDHRGAPPSSAPEGLDKSLARVGEDVSAKAHLALRRLGHQTWRSPEQATAVALAVENRVDFVAILPTGSGKSLVFMAPSAVVDKTVIVVVPLKSLLYGHRAQCTEMGICHETFSDGHRVDAVSPPPIVFVGVETAGSSSSHAFRTFATHLQATGRLQAIVFDEIHTILSAFRPAMRNLLDLMTVKCQIIGLTASLPPEAQVDVERVLDAPFVWVRSATIRPNIRYTAVDVPDINEEIVRRLREWKAASSTTLDVDRAIVYCLSRDEVELTAKALQDSGLRCSHMHAGFDTARSVKSVKDWENKGCEILVATGVIGCGFHYKSVKLVIHKGGFRSLVVFHQESGRAGRDGSPATSCIVSNIAWRRSALRMDSALDVPCKWIEENESCRRMALHAAVDGKPQMCYLIPGAIPCDNCSRGAQDQPPDSEETSQATPAGRSAVPSRGITSGATPAMDAPLEPTATSGLTQLRDNGLPLLAATSRRTEALTTDFQRVRPVEIKDRLEEVTANIRFIRKYAGSDQRRCLLCWNPRAPQTPCSHSVMDCPLVKATPGRGSRCVRCLQEGHPAKNCGNKITSHPDTCFRCHFPHQPDKYRFHEGPYGDNCEDKTGERLRLFMWKAWRYDDLRVQLFHALPEITGFHDNDLRQWLPSSEPGTHGNNFVRFVAAIVRIKFPDFRGVTAEGPVTSSNMGRPRDLWWH